MKKVKSAPHVWTESQRQRAAELLVCREVIHCVSTMVSDLLAMQSLPGSIDHDELMGLASQDDWTTPAADHARNHADTEEARWVVENAVTEYEDELAELADELDHELDCDEPDQAKVAGLLADIRRLVAKVVEDSAEAARDYCEENCLDAERVEALEHWSVTPWLAGKLAERGEIVGDVWDFKVWGRACSGQSISLDNVIQDIACELWPHWFGD